MKKMKKMLALLCAALMVVALAACGGGDTKQGGQDNNGPSALDLYNQANAKMSALEDVEYEMTIDMQMTEPTSGEVIDMTMGGEMKQVKVAENDYNVSFDMNISMPGQGEVDAAMYYTDGWFYYSIPAAGVKLKQAMDLEDAMGQMNSAEMIDISEDMVLDSSVGEEGGKTVVTLKLDGNKMLDYVDEVGGDLTASLQGGEMKLSDVTMKLVMDADANVSVYEIVMPMEVSTQGITMTMDMTMTMEVVATEGVAIELPTDLDTYTEGVF